MSKVYSLSEAKHVLFRPGSLSDIRVRYVNAQKAGWNCFDPRLFDGPEHLMSTQLLGLREIKWNANQTLTSGKPLWFFELEHRDLVNRKDVPWHLKAMGASFTTRFEGEHWLLAHARGLLNLNLPIKEMKNVWLEEWIRMEQEGSTPTLVSINDWKGLALMKKQQNIPEEVWTSLMRFTSKEMRLELVDFIEKGI
jgi:hypothetical protein